MEGQLSVGRPRDAAIRRGRHDYHVDVRVEVVGDG